ncbi:hypothetical protein DLAC_10930 [Tieghemostelium lacteum]|uniref:Uncharacterized protein n=1 Tax=Tieghemostelium lacteum TaxID=361077 RepID=A0A151Z2Q8_TIELA|nr:hypothetical protein DLAC_10930 [Tieghemostelium lacteum]|eukprot:KYQ88242.1 hypothetical protein DLAC_10930 [Tieghemostelium lacteum]
MEFFNQIQYKDVEFEKYISIFKNGLNASLFQRSFAIHRFPRGFEETFYDINNGISKFQPSLLKYLSHHFSFVLRGYDFMASIFAIDNNSCSSSSSPSQIVHKSIAITLQTKKLNTQGEQVIREIASVIIVSLDDNHCTSPTDPIEYHFLLSRGSPTLISILQQWIQIEFSLALIPLGLNTKSLYQLLLKCLERDIQYKLQYFRKQDDNSTIDLEYSFSGMLPDNCDLESLKLQIPIITMISIIEEYTKSQPKQSINEVAITETKSDIRPPPTRRQGLSLKDESLTLPKSRKPSKLQINTLPNFLQTPQFHQVFLQSLSDLLVQSFGLDITQLVLFKINCQHLFLSISEQQSKIIFNNQSNPLPILKDILDVIDNNQKYCV